jgi:hypothetical protein
MKATFTGWPVCSRGVLADGGAVEVGAVQRHVDQHPAGIALHVVDAHEHQDVVVLNAGVLAAAVVVDQPFGIHRIHDGVAELGRLQVGDGRQDGLGDGLGMQPHDLVGEVAVPEDADALVLQNVPVAAGVRVAVRRREDHPVEVVLTGFLVDPPGHVGGHVVGGPAHRGLDQNQSLQPVVEDEGLDPRPLEHRIRPSQGVAVGSTWPQPPAVAGHAYPHREVQGDVADSHFQIDLLGGAVVRRRGGEGVVHDLRVGFAETVDAGVAVAAVGVVEAQPHAAVVDAHSFGLAGGVAGALAGRLAAAVGAVLTLGAVGVQAAFLLTLRPVVSVVTATAEQKHRHDHAQKLDSSHRIPPSVPRVPTQSSAWLQN